MSTPPSEAFTGMPSPTARTRLFAMGATYALGTFNDNFYKQAALLLAASAGLHAIQGWATVLFALPFALFSAWTGWLADRFPKRRVVVLSKFLELAAMLVGLWALFTLNWHGIIAVIFLMALQSTFFSPALNGSIPESFPARKVPRVNALLKLATTSTILLGMALGGMVLDLPTPAFADRLVPQGPYGFGRLALAVAALLVSVLGILSAFVIPKSACKRNVPQTAPFPLFGPVDSVRHALECRANDHALYVVLAGEAFFYSMSAFVLLCINNLGVNELGFSATVTSLLPVALTVGICIGALIGGKRDAASWRQSMIPAGLGIAAGLLAAAFSPLLPGLFRLPYLLPVFILTGLCGGIYLIPLASFIQVRPKIEEKGKVLGISNFASFIGTVLVGMVFMAGGGIAPSHLLAGSGIFTIAFMTWAAWRIGRLADASLADKALSPLAFALRAVLSLRYRVTVRGLADIDAKGPVLFLPNHPALIDPVIVYSILAGLKPRPLSDERQMTGPLGRLAAMAIRAVLIPDPAKDGTGAGRGVKAGLQVVEDALRAGHNVLLYPSGRIYRSSGEKLGAASGAASIIESMPGLRVVLVRTTGLWGSSFSYAGSRGAPDFAKILLRGIVILAANLLLFTPRRDVLVEFTESPDLPRTGGKKVLNPWLESFYNEAERSPAAVPFFFWEGSKPQPLPEYTQAIADGGAGIGMPGAVTDAMREAVYAAVRKAANLDPGHPLTDTTVLATDLGLDSLALMELALALENEQGCAIPSLEGLITVGDCLAAASGNAPIPPEEMRPAPPAWFAPVLDKVLRVPEGASTIPAAFVCLARQFPDAPLLADRESLRTRRDILTGAIILAERFKTLPEQRIGVMLPSVPGAVAVWLAVQLAGKEPVFLNWTAGETNLRHCINLAGVKRVISASALLDRLEKSGLPLAGLPVTWLRLEKLAASLRRWEKLRGFLRARLPLFINTNAVPETAAVLFTSGSESLPKAVPLTHANLLANAGDIIKALRVEADETVLAMLPPFHSFGLLVGLVLPLALGLKAAFHANPTETGPLLALTREYKLSLLAAPPTFLEAMLERARGTDALASLHFAFAGAEKCPDRVYRAFAELCPHAALCEGYGITECSPVVSVNRPDAVAPGTIGHLLPSVAGAVVREEEGAIAGRAGVNETGMLLVRGPSIFGGYLGDAPDPFVPFEGRIWYRTGDLVSMAEDGRLTFRGRLKRFVKIGGEMISLPQIEAALLEAFAGPKDGTEETAAAFTGGFPLAADAPVPAAMRPAKLPANASPAPAEGPALAVEATPDDAGPEIVLFTTLPLTAADANRALRLAGLSPLHSVRRVVPVDAVPLLGSGKTDYRNLKERLKNNPA